MPVVDPQMVNPNEWNGGAGWIEDMAGNLHRSVTPDEAASMASALEDATAFGLSLLQLADAAALGELVDVEQVINNITQVTENNQYIEQITQNQTFIDEITQQITQQTIENNEFVTQLTENNTFVTQLIEQNTFVTELTTLLTQLTEVTENNTYVQNVVQQINANVNGKKGVDLASLGIDGYLTDNQMPPNLLKAAASFLIDGGGSAITAGFKGDLVIPFSGVITGWKLLADQAGSIVVDLWKDVYSNYPPLVGDTIVAAAKPALSSAAKNQSSTLTGWTTAVTAGDIIRINVDPTPASVTKVTLVLEITRSQ